MANSEHVEWLREGVKAWNLRRRREPFEPDLTAADLIEADLSGADLRGADLTAADLSGADLRGADLVGANLREADLVGADLVGADLIEADLSGADLRGANLRGADLRGADITSIKSARRTKNAGRTDFTFARNLVQSQLEEMHGDTGVILPDGLVHPDSWPEWAEFSNESPDGVDTSDKKKPASDIPLPDPFVFLSYDHRDRGRIETIQESLIEAGISCWWDQDIDPGNEWRNEIAQRIKSATVVLTFWTEHSTGSKGVIEEASKAQAAGKLTHVRLDNVELPYGFAETQYTDLSNWHGSASDPRFQSLIMVLHDRLFPPGREMVLHRIAKAGPVSAVPQRGKIGLQDVPIEGKPSVDDPEDLGNRFDAVVHDCLEFLEQWEELQPNVPSTIKRNITKCHDMAESQTRNWHLWERQIKYIEIRLAEDEESDWRGTHEIASLVAQQISGLKPHLKPEVLPDLNQAPLETAPEIKFGEEANIRIAETADAVAIILDRPDSREVFNEEAREFLQEIEKDLAEGMERQGDSSEGASQSRFRFWKLAIGGLAGFVATAVTLTAPNIAANLLTNPDAAKTLHSYLEDLLNLLLTFF